MNSLQKYTVLLFLLLNFVEDAFAQNQSMIIGDWVSIKKETYEGGSGENMTINGKAYTIDIQFNFKLKNSVEVFEYGERVDVEYSLKGDVLQVGFRKYLIERLSKDELVLTDSNKLLRFYFIRKVKK